MRLLLHDEDAKHNPWGETSPNPARRAAGHAPVRARPQHSSPEARPPPEARAAPWVGCPPRPPTCESSCGRLGPSRPSVGRGGCRRRQRCSLSSVTCPLLMPGPFPHFGGRQDGWEVQGTRLCVAAKLRNSQMLWGVKLCGKEKYLRSLTGGTLVNYIKRF